jgi:hypothetical protein
MNENTIGMMNTTTALPVANEFFVRCAFITILKIQA